MAIVFKPQADRIVSKDYFEAGTVVALPSRDWLNLYEPRTVRRLLDAVAERGGLPTKDCTKEVDGWPLFFAVVGADSA
ncbi:hypothetical protein ABIA32_001989 [Streptacidiphilus sp. MAP12-20]|uniref:hypothetical protein n=1 Tax=Streptacidiphilus sp. MAP12-20 TaxID=3156299 RepID=UPI003510D372